MKGIFQFLARRPEVGLALSFFVIILVGAFLLNLPWAATEDISFLDALFTSASATCVTGLNVKDIGRDFTTFGQTIIMILTQLGILEIMAWATFLFLILRKRMGITGETFFKDVLDADFRKEAKGFLKFIFLSILLIEAAGAIILFLSWNEYFPNLGQAVFSSVFHSVSAFANSGFSLFSESIQGFQSSFSVNIVFGLLIFLGALGFLTLKEFKEKFFSYFKKPRSRIKISLYSKIVIYTSLGLVVLGAVSFYFFEAENLSYLSKGDLWLASFFQSINKTSGFNTVDIGALSSPTIFIFMFLMFVGGAAGSAAGGVKVVSLALIIIFIVSFLKGKEGVIISKRSIPSFILKKTFALVSVCMIILLVGALILMYTEKGQFEVILFEAFSAFGTVGLSMGLTPVLTAAGKITVIMLMYLGRIITLALILIWSRSIISPKIRFPEEKIFLG